MWLCLTAVKTVGRPASLFLKPEIDITAPSDNVNQNSMEVLPDQRPIKDKILSSFIEKNRDQVSDLWSNESLASNSSVGRLDLLSELASVDGDNLVDGSYMESGSGEGLSELEAMETASVQSSMVGDGQRLDFPSKPPNILIYVGKIDVARKFDRVKKVLENCLDIDSYVIYLLKHEDLDTIPWIDNTTLLVLASRKSYPDANAAFMQYFLSGGKIISFGSGFDSEIIGVRMVRQEAWIGQQTYRDWSNITLISGGHVYDIHDLKLADSHVMPLGSDSEKRVSMVKVTLERKDVISSALLSQVTCDGCDPSMYRTSLWLRAKTCAMYVRQMI